ncbi:MAG: hypothetical protein V7723_13300 [Sneathiella sp.]|uniref:hypothetical protein n=1 Tax=Sneathiella sp. TaxID=1964365 RepID=UPI003001A46B
MNNQIKLNDFFASGKLDSGKEYYLKHRLIASSRGIPTQWKSTAISVNRDLEKVGLVDLKENCYLNIVELRDPKNTILKFF